MAEQYLNKEGVQTLWTAVKGKISTAQTTVENEFVNGTKKAKYAQQADNIGGVALSGLVQSIKVGSKTFSPKNSVVTLDDYALSTHTHTFASLTSKPTTISGYGITDAYTKKEADGKYATKATTLSGYGITDAYTKTESDKKYQPVGNYSSAGHTHTFASLTSKPTTLSGYGITDAYTKTESDGKYATKTDSDTKYQPAGSYATLDSNGKVPSSQLPSYVDDVIEGYYSNGKFYSDSAKTKEITGEGGKIYTDLTTNKTYRWGGTAWVEISASLALGEIAGTAYDGKKGHDTNLIASQAMEKANAHDNTLIALEQNKANKATTLAGYGIADAYTKTESDGKYQPKGNYASSAHTHTFDSLTNKPKTLSGYGITDAYTKTETDGKYVPTKSENNTNSNTMSNEDGAVYVTNANKSTNSTVSELFVDNSSVGMRYGVTSITITMSRARPQVVINDISHNIAIDTDLPTAISASDLNTILV